MPPETRVDPATLDIVTDDTTGPNRISVRVDKQRLAAYICIEHLDPTAGVSASSIEKLISDAGIEITAETRDTVQSVVRQAENVGIEGRAFFLTAGTPAEEGRDGRIIWRVPYSGKPLARMTADGRVDYRELGLITNVAAGQLIFEVVPPTPGRIGTDVLGRTIHPRPGRPVRVRKGRGVRVAEDDRHYYAEVDGRVVFEGGLIMVEPVFEVRGDVDYSVGNIDFNGAVKVLKSVLEGFVVKATGPIEVLGHVEAAELVSGNDIVIHGGVNGKRRGKIRAAGSISARYLNEADVEAGGDIVVQKSVSKSAARCRGNFFAENGAVKGGGIMALGNVSVGILGSEMGVVTQVTVGVEYELAAELAHIGAEIAELEKARNRITAGIGPYLDDPSKRDALDGEARQAVDRLARQAEQYQESIDELSAKRDALAERLSESRKSRITVSRRLEAGVVARIGRYSRRVDESLVGPLELVPDVHGKTLAIMGTER